MGTARAGRMERRHDLEVKFVLPLCAIGILCLTSWAAAVRFVGGLPIVLPRFSLMRSGSNCKGNLGMLFGYSVHFLSNPGVNSAKQMRFWIGSSAKNNSET